MAAVAPQSLPAVEKRPAWKRGASLRGNNRSAAHRPQRITTSTKPDDLDGYVPYRPPFAAKSAASLPTSVQPSGAQGIGLVPAPPPPPPIPQEKRRGLFGWATFGLRRRKRPITSPSAPALLHPGASTASFGTTYAGLGHHARMHPVDIGGGNIGTRFSAYAPKGKQFVQTSPADPAPSVLTGLMAPNMLFSPLSRTLRPNAPGNNMMFGSSTPNLPSSAYTYNEPVVPMPHIEHTSVHHRPHYPRVGANVNTASGSTLPTGNRSSVTLHSEGSKSRLTVSSMCDALTFPRPRMNAHDITPPDSPNDIYTTDEEYDLPFQEAVEQSRARETEREEWADRVQRRRSGSLRRSHESSSAPTTPRRPRRSDSRHTISAEKPKHKRSRSQSSVRSFFSRRRRTLTDEDFSMVTRPPSDHSLSGMSQNLDSFEHRTQAWQTGSLRGMPGTSVTGSSSGDLAAQALPKSLSSPQLAVDANGGSRRSQSVRHASKSNPDLAGRSRTITGAPGSDRRSRHRPAGPPRSFQFRPQSQQEKRHGIAPTGVVVVGPSSASTPSARTPRTIDFIDLDKAYFERSNGSTAPYIPTPNCPSPFGLSSDEIGVAITTSGNELIRAPPPKAPTRQPVPPLQASPLPKEPPSSAHARYLLARQHRRSVTMRAFQSPAVPVTTAVSKGHNRETSVTSPPDTLSPISPNALELMSPTSPTSPMSPSRQERIDYPTRKAAARVSSQYSIPEQAFPPPLPSFTAYSRALDESSPVSPVSPASSRGAYLSANTSTLGPRVGKPPGRVRSRANSASSGISNTASATPPTGSMPIPPVPLPTASPVVSAFDASSMSRRALPIPPGPSPQREKNRPPPLRLDKALPPVPRDTSPALPEAVGVKQATSPQSPFPRQPASPSSATSPTRSRIPRPRAPPSRPVPPTPLSRPTSTGSLAFQTHSRGDSITTVLAAMDAVSTSAWPSSPTRPTKAKEQRLSSYPLEIPEFPAPPAAQTRPVTPPRQARTIMDDSPTPLRQNRVPVLAPAPATPRPVTPSPVPRASDTPSPFSSLRTPRNRAMASSDNLFNRQSVPTQGDAGTGSLAIRRHRSRPSISAVTASTDSFRAPIDSARTISSSEGDYISDEGHRDQAHSRVSPEFYGHDLGVRNRSGSRLAVSPEGSFALADTSGTLGRFVSESPQRISPVPPRRPTPEAPSIQSFQSAQSFSELSVADSDDTFYNGRGRPSPIRQDSSTSQPSFVSSEVMTGEGEHWETPTSLHSHLEEGTPPTRPELVPLSSTSALSHYTDALEGSNWSSPVESTVEQFETPLLEEPPSVDEDIERAPTPTQHIPEPQPAQDLPPTSPSVDATRRESLLSRLPRSQDMESLTMTPRPQFSRHTTTETPESEDAFEFDARGVRRSPSATSVSSSEVSLRQSMDEHFRGLFYRTPHAPSPASPPRRRLNSSPMPRSLFLRPTTPHERSHEYAPSSASPNEGTMASEATFELRTPIIPERATTRDRLSVGERRFSSRLAQYREHITAPPTFAPPSPAAPHGLGLMASSANIVPGFDTNRIDISRTPPPSSPTTRNDSWITESYKRMSQGMMTRSATPAHRLSLRKPRPHSMGTDGVLPFSPTTFGVHSYLDHPSSPGPSTPRSPRHANSSGSSVADPITPHPDVVDKFPSPPNRRD